MQSEHILSSYLFQSAPSVLQLATVDQLETMLSQVVKILDSFEQSSLKVLYYMKDSPKYIDNVYNKLMHFKMLSQKSLQKVAELEEKRAAHYQELSSNGPRIAKLIARTESLQKKVSNHVDDMITDH